jgi:phosphate transport system substrate-binding protein
MTFRRQCLSLLCAALVLTTAACQPELSQINPDEADLLVSGSSTVFPIMQQGARLFMTEFPEALVATEFTGTTAGFRRFCAGEIHISAASREIDDSERQACNTNQVNYIRLDVATDAIAVVTHPTNRWLQGLTVDQLRAIWSADAEGKITRWQQIDSSWPDRPLNLYGRGIDSGTYDYFTAQLNGLRQSRLDYRASEDEELLAALIAADRNSLGFFGLGAYHRHWDELRLVGIDSGNGVVFPDLETASSGRYQPFTRPLYMYVRVPVAGSFEGIDPLVLEFLRHFYGNVSAWLHFTGFLPLEDSRYAQILSSMPAAGS